MTARPRRGRIVAVAAAAVLLAGAALPACGTGATTKTPAPPVPNTRITGITVFAAASLADLLPAMVPRVRQSFAGSDQLAFQIRQGAPADVFVSANVRYPDELFAAGLVERPVIVALNNLVVLVPRANPARTASVRDLARPGVKLVIGDASVPVGAYTRTVLRRLRLESALANVVSNEPDVRGVVAKVALGEADAGIAYLTDARAVASRVRRIAIPAEAQPTVAYSAAVSRSARNPAAARTFVRFLTSPQGRRWFVRYGFQLR